MIRPVTCICLVLAAGSGLYLYQVKQRAFTLDADLRNTFHQIDEARERTRMLRADWALMNDPERLQALASQYLTLQPMAPSQLMTMDQLAAALPAPIRPGTRPPAAPAPAPAFEQPMPGMPMAMAAPRTLPHAHPADPAVALLQPAAPAPAAAPPAAPVALRAVLPPPPPSFAEGAPARVFTPRVFTPRVFTPPVLAPTVAIDIPARSEPVAVPRPVPVHHAVRHAAPTPQIQPGLADAKLAQSDRPRRAHRHAAPPAAQLYAANEPARQQPYVPPRITPPVATVMYSPASASSLGMAASANLAPPRPLYSTAQ